MEAKLSNNKGSEKGTYTNMNSESKPHRRHEVTIRIGADTLNDLVVALDELKAWVTRTRATGGLPLELGLVSAQWSLEADEAFDPDANGDTYMKALRAFTMPTAAPVEETIKQAQPARRKVNRGRRPRGQKK
jgi:hypothetical protein